MEAGLAERTPLALEGQETAAKEESSPRPAWRRASTRAALATALAAILLLAGAALQLPLGSGARDRAKADMEAAVSEVANGMQIPLSKWDEMRDFVANIKTGGYICTGIVAGNHVITARHCTNKGRQAKDIRVQVSSQPDKWLDVTKIDRHQTLDVAVLTLSKKHRNSKRLVLDSVVPNVGAKFRLTGFGENHKGTAGSELHDTKALTRTACNHGDGIICAGSGPASGTSSCGGDSGGPWFQLRNNGKRVEIVGVNSYGFGGSCGDPDKETGLVSVAAMKEWLQRYASDFSWGEATKCADANNGATDKDGDGCEWYTKNDHNGDECGLHDDDDFQANVMCCACAGGNGPED